MRPPAAGLRPGLGLGRRRRFGSPAAPRLRRSRAVVPEADFTETERSRDPFRPYAKFAEEAKGRVKSQRQVLLASSRWTT
jgi:hypothetical protein